jgi:hypothetical protein
MTHELMAVEIEVHPVRITASLGTSKDISIESPRLRDIPDLQGDMKWRKHRQHLLHRALIASLCRIFNRANSLRRNS